MCIGQLGADRRLGQPAEPVNHIQPDAPAGVCVIGIVAADTKEPPGVEARIVQGRLQHPVIAQRHLQAATEARTRTHLVEPVGSPDHRVQAPTQREKTVDAPGFDVSEVIAQAEVDESILGPIRRIERIELGVDRSDVEFARPTCDQGKTRGVIEVVMRRET